MNNLLSYCGLVDTKIRASEKDLPVPSLTLLQKIPFSIKKGELTQILIIFTNVLVIVF